MFAKHFESRDDTYRTARAMIFSCAKEIRLMILLTPALRTESAVSAKNDGAAAMEARILLEITKMPPFSAWSDLSRSGTMAWNRTTGPIVFTSKVSPSASGLVLRTVAGPVQSCSMCDGRSVGVSWVLLRDGAGSRGFSPSLARRSSPCSCCSRQTLTSRLFCGIADSGNWSRLSVPR